MSKKDTLTVDGSHVHLLLWSRAVELRAPCGVHVVQCVHRRGSMNMYESCIYREYSVCVCVQSLKGDVNWRFSSVLNTEGVLLSVVSFESCAVSVCYDAETQVFVLLHSVHRPASAPDLSIHRERSQQRGWVESPWRSCVLLRRRRMCRMKI